jgi:hypothetical protein
LTKGFRPERIRAILAVLAVWALFAPRPAEAQLPPFPQISFRAFAGVPSSTGADSTASNKVTLRWVRDRAAEQRSDFGGYRIWRATSVRDTTNMELLRRFVVRGASRADTLADGSPNTSIYARRDTLLWYFPDNQDTLQFVDPDSAGKLEKVCRRRDNLGRCLSPGDSVFVFVTPNGPHDGFALYYSITYGSVDQTLRETADMFVPDSLDAYARCSVPGDRTSCPNLNNKLLNLMVDPVFVKRAASSNVEAVIVVPNPYRARERWDTPGSNRVQFMNVPADVRVRIFTIAGDLVRELLKTDPTSGNLDWDLKNQQGEAVASGIYTYHVLSGEGYESKGHFVVVR